jgi:hypothetical protein
MTSYKSKGSWTLAGSEAINSPIEGTRRYRTSDAPWEPTQLDGFWIKSLYELLRSRGVRWPGPCRMRETFRSTQSIAAGALPAPFAGARPLSSALYLMVTPIAPVRLHRNPVFDKVERTDGTFCAPTSPTTRKATLMSGRPASNSENTVAHSRSHKLEVTDLLHPSRNTTPL